MDLAILITLLVGLPLIFLRIRTKVDTSKYDNARVEWSHRERDLRSEIGGLKAEIRFNHARINDLEQDIVYHKQAKDNSDTAFISLLTQQITKG